MSLVVAVQDTEKGTVEFAADSILTSHWVSRSTKDVAGKMFFKRGVGGLDFVVGGVGSPRLIQLMQYGFNLPLRGEEALNTYMVNTFIPAWIDFLDNSGALYVKDSVSQMEDTSFIFGIGPNLFTMYGDFQIAHHTDEYSAIGAGEEFALGSLFTTEVSELTAKERAEVALEAAITFSPWVRDPIVFASTGDFARMGGVSDE
jgi:hypothetical protein